MNELSAFPPDLAPLRASLDATPAECASGTAPAAIPAHRWKIECVGWRPCAAAPGKLGHARLMLPGGMILSGATLFRTLDGPRLTFARQHHRDRDPAIDGPPPRAIWFPNPDDWAAFSTAAVAAIEAFAPGALANPPTAAPDSRHTAPGADPADNTPTIRNPASATLAPVLPPTNR